MKRHLQYLLERAGIPPFEEQKLHVLPHAPSRLAGDGPICVIDIGSNSVRMVCYERLSRTPTPIFNEKALCGLGYRLALTGNLDGEAIKAALNAIRRFAKMAEQLGAKRLIILATAAARNASNGKTFIRDVARITGHEPLVLSGTDEARYSGYGVLSGMHDPNGVMGDMGGGSLEIARIQNAAVGSGKTFVLGGLYLQDLAQQSPEKALRIARNSLAGDDTLTAGEGRPFYAIGGTWRSLATLHMKQNNYPLNILHHYEVEGDDMADFCAETIRGKLQNLPMIEHLSENRVPLLQYGAGVLLAIIEQMKPDKIVICALGIREGLLYERLTPAMRAQDGLLAGASELSYLRSRSSRNTSELFDWTMTLLKAANWPMDGDLWRWHKAACLLSDVGWRAHPDHRGEQSFNIIAHAPLIALDHRARAFIALSAYFRHKGQLKNHVIADIASLLDEDLIKRARLNGVLFRLGHLISAAAQGVLPKSSFIAQNDHIILRLPQSQEASLGNRVWRRLAQIEKIIGIKTRIEIDKVSRPKFD